MPKLPPLTKSREEILTEWIAALRSGKYAQTKSRLRTERGFCCLGVLVDVAYGSCAWQTFNGQYYVDNSGSYLPPDLATRVGLMNIGPDFESLSRMNDKEDKSFSEIADYIEQNPNGIKE